MHTNAYMLKQLMKRGTRICRRALRYVWEDLKGRKGKGEILKLNYNFKGTNLIFLFKLSEVPIIERLSVHERDLCPFLTL